MYEQKAYKHYSDVQKKDWHWPNFTPKEVACKGTGRLVIDRAAMDALQALRTALGTPLIINSAYRSPEHNASIGGAKNSQHVKGKAFDIRLTMQREVLTAAAKKCGFTGIGQYDRFIHVDTGPKRQWDYRK